MPSRKIEQRPAQPSLIEAPEVLRSLSALEKELIAVRKTIIREFRELLRGLRGKRFETQAEATATVNAIKRFVRVSGQHLFYRGVPVTLQTAFPPRATKASSIQVRSFLTGKPIYLHTGPEFPQLTIRLTR